MKVTEKKQLKKEHRQFKRALFVFPVRIGIVTEREVMTNRKPREFFHAFSDNISQGGLKITLRQEWAGGTRLLLRFDLVEGEKVHLVETLAVVRRIKRLREGLYEYGIEFDPLKKDDWDKVASFMRDYCVS